MWKWMQHKIASAQVLSVLAFIALTSLVFTGPAGSNSENATSSTEIAPTTKTPGTVDPNGDGAVDFSVVAFGPNANARLSLDLIPNGGAGNQRNDGVTSGTVAGAGTDVVVEVFITGLAGSIIGGEFSIDTNRLSVKSAAATQGLSVLGTAAKTVSLGGFPPGVALPNGYLGTVTLTTTSDVTNVAFTVSASMTVADGTNIGETDMLTAAPLSFNTTPPPPPSPPFSLSLDGDDATGDQAVKEVDVSPGAVATIQVFGKGIRNATGVSARFEYDSAQVTYEGFDAGGILPNAQVIAVPLRNPTAVEISLVSFGGQATADSGLVGNIRFRTMSAFSSTTLWLVRADLGRGTQTERVTFADIQITLQPAALTPDFNGDGRVNFADFLLFTAQFGLRRGDAGYEARFDLDGDGTIGFGDFLIFGRAFGREES